MASRRDDANVFVTHPRGMAEAFKRLAAERTNIARTQNLPPVWAQDLHEEAVRRLLERLRRGEEVVFLASPFRKNVRKTMWLDRGLLAEVKEVATRCDVPVATVVLIACLAYLEAHGIQLK